MRCPHCGGGLKVSHTRRRGPYTLRYRVCAGCKRRYKTPEMQPRKEDAY